MVSACPPGVVARYSLYFIKAAPPSLDGGFHASWTRPSKACAVREMGGLGGVWAALSMNMAKCGWGTLEILLKSPPM